MGKEEELLNWRQMPDDRGHNQTQKALMDFLRIESKLARTFLQTAAIDIRDEPADAMKSVSKSREALATIRRLGMKLDDPRQQAEIEGLASELEGGINSFAALRGRKSI